MSFVIGCPLCHQAVTVSGEQTEQALACPHCQAHFQISSHGTAGVPLATPLPSGDPTSSTRRFVFACQRCDSSLEAMGSQCGQPGRCPTCGAAFTVPDIDPSTGRARSPALVADDGQLPTPMHAYATAGARAPQIRRRPDGTQVILCPRCRREMPIDADACTACGIPFTVEGAPTGEGPGPSTNGMATAALTVGILAVLSSCLPILAPVAIGLGVVGMKRAEAIRGGDTGRGMAIAGVVCGAAAIALFVVFQLADLL